MEFDLNKYFCQCNLVINNSSILCLILLSDGRFVSGSNDSKIKIYNNNTYIVEILIESICNPNNTTIVAASICPNNF